MMLFGALRIVLLYLLNHGCDGLQGFNIFGSTPQPAKPQEVPPHQRALEALEELRIRKQISSSFVLQSLEVEVVMFFKDASRELKKVDNVVSEWSTITDGIPRCFLRHFSSNGREIWGEERIINDLVYVDPDGRALATMYAVLPVPLYLEVKDIAIPFLERERLLKQPMTKIRLEVLRLKPPTTYDQYWEDVHHATTEHHGWDERASEDFDIHSVISEFMLDTMEMLVNRGHHMFKNKKNGNSMLRFDKNNLRTIPLQLLVTNFSRESNGVGEIKYYFIHPTGRL